MEEVKMCNVKPHAGERIFNGNFMILFPYTHLERHTMKKRGEEIKLRIFFAAILN